MRVWRTQLCCPDARLSQTPAAKARGGRQAAGFRRYVLFVAAVVVWRGWR